RTSIILVISFLLRVGKMPPKRASTTEAPAMTQDAIRKLVVDSVTSALEAQAATMASASNPDSENGKLQRVYQLSTFLL
ncbi:hypothetical protein Tco_1332957, partial [Tanacetum coccineum]